ncbi:Deubiquitinating protein [Mactra antiquata]
MSSLTKRQKSWDTAHVMYGTCPDEECQAKLYFPSHEKSIECTTCGQRHERQSLKDVAEVTNPEVALHNLLKNILLGNMKPKKGADNVKVLGLSNYVCKLISPILTYYGLERETGKAKLLSAMGKGEVFDVSILGDRAFLIDEEHLSVIGYGRDRSGSMSYLADTLNDIKSFNNNEMKVVPIHADGDGHCLVHAISRALVGRELFWHALRVNLKNHMTHNLQKYKEVFRDFVDRDEWNAIIEECDPDFLPPIDEAHGLRNIHIFGLANVLHRPIILLDSKSGMNSVGDYSGVFLPGFISPEDCRGKDGSLNKPLCIAWSSPGRNHYIPLVSVKGKEPAFLPSYMVQKSWGMPKEEIKKYIEFDNMYRCSIGGTKCLTDKYLRTLVGIMEDVYMEQNDVNPNLVADVHQYIYKSAGMVGVHPEDVLQRTKNALKAKQLYRCLMCEALVEFVIVTSEADYMKGGTLYNLAVKIHKKLDPTKLYNFPLQGTVCSYDAEKDCLVPDSPEQPKSCAFCNGEMLRQVRHDGSIVYIDGDRTTTPCNGGTCPCGYKHYWQGKEYDNLPDIFPISLQWGGKLVTEKIAWFQFESDPTLNSNVFEVAQSVVQKHFPGEFGSERLVQRVVDSILRQSAMLNKERGRETTPDDTDDNQRMDDNSDVWSADTASKIILTGQKKKTLHKEELMKSEAEKQVRKNIQSKAQTVQRKKTTYIESQKASTSKMKPPVCQTSSKSSTTLQTGLQSKQSNISTSTSQSGTQSTTLPSSLGEKKLRLQTSDGRQEMLTLVKDVTYSELQKLIYEAVGVPAIRQKIRVGFPPKLLGEPAEGEEEKILTLHHGDKLALEVIPDVIHSVKESSSQASGSSSMATSWSSFEEDAQSRTADKLLQALKEVPQGGDNIDTSIASLAILSAVQGKDLWTHVQSMPHLFSIGGLLYNQVKRDLGLVDGKHCQIPSLPGKVFRYTAIEDRLELCLEPYGHFPVEPNIEQRVKSAGLQTSQDEVKFGASGVVHHGTERQAFLGQGHSLKSTINTDERMPMDLECASSRSHVRGIHDLCSPPGSTSQSITEEPDDMQTDDSTTSASATQDSYQRLGPGYSVIDQSSTNMENANLDMFRALAEHIEKTLADNTSMNQDSTDDPSTVNSSNNQNEPNVQMETEVTEAGENEVKDEINSEMESVVHELSQYVCHRINTTKTPDSSDRNMDLKCDINVDQSKDSIVDNLDQSQGTVEDHVDGENLVDTVEMFTNDVNKLTEAVQNVGDNYDVTEVADIKRVLDSKEMQDPNKIAEREATDKIPESVNPTESVGTDNVTETVVTESSDITCDTDQVMDEKVDISVDDEIQCDEEVIKEDKTSEDRTDEEMVANEEEGSKDCV